MKYSQFNSIIPFDNKFALFNSYSQKAIILVPELKDILNAGVVEGIENLESIHPTFYQYLVENEFVIPSNVDEIQKVKELSKKEDENPNTFLLTINPTMNCNFKCWYCYETHIKQSKLTDEMIERINKFIALIISNKELTNFSLSFFGGEPLLYFKKEVVPIIDYYSENCIKNNIYPDISFTTNGYLVNQEFIDYFQSKNLKCSLQITLDGYKEEHDKVRYVSKSKGSYEEIISNIKLLITNNFFVRLRINYTDKNLHDTSLIAKEFDSLSDEAKSFLLFDFHRVWQDSKLDDLSVVLEKNIEEVREEGINATGGYSPNNVRESCYADKRNSVVINYNGDIYKCTARDFTTENRAGILDKEGRLIWNDGYIDTRMSVKFKNKPCLSCRIMPLCNGGCSQHALEKQGEDYCVYHGDENEKNKVIKTKVEEIFANV